MKTLKTLKKIGLAVVATVGLFAGTLSTHVNAEESIIITAKAQENITKNTTLLVDKTKQFNAPSPEVNKLVKAYEQARPTMTEEQEKAAMKKIFNAQSIAIAEKANQLKAYSEQLKATIDSYIYALNSAKPGDKKRNLSEGKGRDWFVDAITQIQGSLSILENINTPEAHARAKSLSRSLKSLAQAQKIQARRGGGVTDGLLEETIEVLHDAQSNVQLSTTLLIAQAEAMMNVEAAESTSVITAGITQIGLDVSVLSDGFISNVSPLIDRYLGMLGYGGQSNSYVDSSTDAYDLSGVLSEAKRGGHAN